MNYIPSSSYTTPWRLKPEIKKIVPKSTELFWIWIRTSVGSIIHSRDDVNRGDYSIDQEEK